VTDLDVTVILPCLDEADSVAGCIAEARTGLERAGLSGEVVVVDNGSTDGSARLARDAGARVIREPEVGYGAALRRGIREARGAFVVMADADNTYDLSRLGEVMAPLLADEADLVLGARLDGANRRTMPMLHRWLGTPILSFLVRRAGHDIDVTDSQSGYRAMRAETAQRLGLRASGMEFASEMLIKASIDGLRITERDLGYRPRIGESKLQTMRDGLRHLQQILMMAPQLLLFWPGLAMLTLGVLLGVASLVEPAGFDLGPLRWQPVFFGPILMVLGTMATLSGIVLAHHSPLARLAPQRPFGFVSERRFALGTAGIGGAALTLGLAIDLALFFVWIANETSPSRAIVLAGIAQALVITGVVLVAFGLVYRVITGQQGYTDIGNPVTIDLEAADDVAA
jgi:hypothetical protein